jgi:hypothetical protein
MIRQSPDPFLGAVLDSSKTLDDRQPSSAQAGRVDELAAG